MATLLHVGPAIHPLTISEQEIDQYLFFGNVIETSKIELGAPLIQDPLVQERERFVHYNYV